jgi:hypothetical protein
VIPTPDVAEEGRGKREDAIKTREDEQQTMKPIFTGVVGE